MALPKRKSETGSDDISLTDQDINSLVKKFIAPIDQIRSYSRPGASFSGDPKEPFQELQTSSLRPIESRAHAFLRFIGFPVAVEGDFYNPGFNPKGIGFLGTASGAIEKRRRVNEKFANASFREIIFDRETLPQDNQAIFARKDLNSALYAILLTKDIRPFQFLDESLGPFEIDNQNIEISFRELTADQFLTENDRVESNSVSSLQDLLGVSFNETRHILKPFVVDPRIDLTVMPDTSRIAVPFLANENDLKVDENKFVKRPGIELIIRERLRASNSEDVLFLELLEKIANNDNSPSDLVIDTRLGLTVNTRQLRNTAEAILDDNDLNSGSILELQGITTVQVKIINDLVKSLKGILNVLRASLDVVSKTRTLINWVPLPNPEGPEFGSRGASLAVEDVSSTLNLIDKNIKRLRLEKIAAEYQITQRVGIGDFASPFEITSSTKDVPNINEQLSKLESERNKLADLAFKAMGNIESIVGEVSGLGLIDVICVYIALWAMDEESLISMLDDDSFNRLVNNFEDLVVGAASSRQQSGSAPQTIDVALGNFESKLRNVLNFADREFARQSLAPTEEEGGTLS